MKFSWKILRIGGAGKWPFFELAILNFFFSRRIFFCFISMKTSSPFIWGIIYFCTMDGFFRILEKTSFQLICTRLYVLLFIKVQLFWEGHKNVRNRPYGFEIYLVNVKTMRTIAQIFVAFSEKLNFTKLYWYTVRPKTFTHGADKGWNTNDENFANYFHIAHHRSLY